MKKLAQKIVIILGILLVVFWGYLSIKEPFWKDREITKCGTIQNTLAGDRPAKYHLVNELYLGIKFDSGEFEAVNVSPSTYMQKKPGDRVCFTSKDTSYIGYEISSSMFFLIIVVFGLTFMVLGLMELFKEDK